MVIIVNKFDLWDVVLIKVCNERFRTIVWCAFGQQVNVSKEFANGKFFFKMEEFLALQDHTNENKWKKNATNEG